MHWGRSRSFSRAIAKGHPGEDPRSGVLPLANFLNFYVAGRRVLPFKPSTECGSYFLRKETHHDEGNRRGRAEPEANTCLVEQLRYGSTPLRRVRDLDPLLEHIGEARFVLLGEASHGTSEYYTWRAEISRRLITEKGFQFIAVEGDWPSCDQLDRYIKDQGDGDAEDAFQSFDRWPSWMWANEEIAELADWLKSHNRGRSDQVGFHGLDVYSLWDSLYAVIGYLRRVDPGAIDTARRAFRCFEPYGEDAQEYARATARLVPSTCEEEAVALLADIRRNGPAYREDDRWAAFRADQNALVVRDAEAYYRAMIRGGPESWNVRDRHMQETLERLAKFYGPMSRGIVWEHNTHIGDARFTDMAGDGMVNLGQLSRERWVRETPSSSDSRRIAAA